MVKRFVFLTLVLLVSMALAACTMNSSNTNTLAEAESRAFEVQDVQVDIGQGSPIPVEIVVSGTWPDLCAQLFRIEQSVEERLFQVEIIARPSQQDCSTDQLGLPFRLRLPLNMVEMEAGSYTVEVNGVTANFDWPSSEPAPVNGQSDAYVIAYIGRDGNLWVGSLRGMDSRQITSDATVSTGGAASDLVVSYYFPKISSDGRFVAVRRDLGQQVASGFEYTFGLNIYDLETGEFYEVLDQTPAGFDWKPGSHILAYAIPAEEGYFTTRGEVNGDLARSIQAFDMDTMTESALVNPEAGFAIYSPVWSPDGRYLSFEEVYSYEGSGMFAYFDFETMTYHRWEEAIGQYDWSPDSTQVIYDRLTYTMTGEERLYLRDLDNGQEQMLVGVPADGYAIFPAFSPVGGQVAYFVGQGDVDSQMFHLYFQNLSGGEPQFAGDFPSTQPLHWTADGRYVIFSFGAQEPYQIVAVSMVDSSLSLVAEGTFPSSAVVSP